MKSAKQLKEEYEAALKQLQEECPHTELTDYLPVYWAAGHSSGYSAKFCKFCNKQISIQQWCRICRKELLDDEAKQGTGKGHFAFGPSYCEDCLKLTDEEYHARGYRHSGWNERNECIACGRKV